MVRLVDIFEVNGKGQWERKARIWCDPRDLPYDPGQGIQFVIHDSDDAAESTANGVGNS